MLHGVVILYAQTGRMPPAGMRRREICCQCDFQPVRYDPEFCTYIWRRKSARHYSIFSSNSNRWHFALLSTMVANRPCNSGVKSSPELFFPANTCVCIFVLVRQILYQQTQRRKFFLFRFRQMLLRPAIKYMHTCAAANFCAQGPVENIIAVNLDEYMFGLLVKLPLFWW